jgi:hypothetical protein
VELVSEVYDRWPELLQSCFGEEFDTEQTVSDLSDAELKEWAQYAAGQCPGQCGQCGDLAEQAVAEVIRRWGAI